MTRILAVALGVFVLISGALGWFLWDQIKANGKLQASVDQLQATVKAKTQATQGRAQTDEKVRKMAPADVLKRLE